MFFVDARELGLSTFAPDAPNPNRDPGSAPVDHYTARQKLMTWVMDRLIDPFNEANPNRRLAKAGHQVHDLDAINDRHVHRDGGCCNQVFYTLGILSTGEASGTVFPKVNTSQWDGRDSKMYADNLDEHFWTPPGMFVAAFDPDYEYHAGHPVPTYEQYERLVRRRLFRAEIVAERDCSPIDWADVHPIVAPTIEGLTVIDPLTHPVDANGRFIIPDYPLFTEN